jgi:hypothetical protein
MPPIRPRAAAIALALLVAACVSAPVRTGTATVDDRFARGGATWNTGALIDFAVAARETPAGELSISGVWTVRSETASTIQFTPSAVATGVVQMGGRNVLRRPDRFPRLPDGATLEGATAACLGTGIPWRPDFAADFPRLRFVRQAYDCDFDGGFGACWVFRGTGTQPPRDRG